MCVCVCVTTFYSLHSMVCRRMSRFITRGAAQHMAQVDNATQSGTDGNCKKQIYCHEDAEICGERRRAERVMGDGWKRGNNTTDIQKIRAAKFVRFTEREGERVNLFRFGCGTFGGDHGAGRQRLQSDRGLCGRTSSMIVCCPVISASRFDLPFPWHVQRVSARTWPAANFYFRPFWGGGGVRRVGVGACVCVYRM